MAQPQPQVLANITRAAHAGQQRGVAWKGDITIKPKVRQDDAADAKCGARGMRPRDLDISRLSECGGFSVAFLRRFPPPER